MASGFHATFSSHGNKFVLVNVPMLSHWTKAFPCRKANDSSVAKILLEKILSPGKALLNSTMTRKPILPCRHFTEFVIFGRFYNTFIVHYYPLTSQLVQHHNGNTGDPIGKICRDFPMTWAKGIANTSSKSQGHPLWSSDSQPWR